MLTCTSCSRTLPDFIEKSLVTARPNGMTMVPESCPGVLESSSRNSTETTSLRVFSSSCTCAMAQSGLAGAVSVVFGSAGSFFTGAAQASCQLP
ncbi:hypothetical protein D3C86_1693420 [compost metagenome]